MSTPGGAGGGGAGVGRVELEGGVEFFAVARAKHVLKSFSKTTLGELWCASMRGSRDKPPTARRDLIAGLRKLIEQAGNRHLTQLPSTDVLRSVAVALKVPLTRTNASKAECAKRISEFLDDNGLEYMLERLDDDQLTALCQTLGMTLVVNEDDETLDRRQRISLSIRAAINSAGLHVFMESLDTVLIEQMAEELSLPLTAEPAGAKKRTKKDVLITRILTHKQGGYQQRASPVVPVPIPAAPSVGDKAKEKATAPEEKERNEEESVVDDEDTEDLDLDNLAQHSLDQLKAYCAEERLVVPKPRTKKNYIDAIIAHNDKLEREEQAAMQQQDQPREGSASPSPSSSSSSSSSLSPGAAVNNKPRRYTMLTLVKNEGSVAAQPQVAEPAPKATPPRQEIKQKASPPPPPSPSRQAGTAQKKAQKGKKRPREDDEGEADEEEEKVERVVRPAAVVREAPAAESGDAKVNALLTSIGLSKYIAKFDAEEIDMGALRLLDEGHMVALGMPLGSRIKLLQQIAILKASSHDKQPQQPAVKRQRTNEGSDKDQKDQASEGEMEQEEEKQEEPKPKRSSLGRARRRSREMDLLAQQQRKWERRDEAKERRRSFTPIQVAGVPALSEGGDDEQQDDALPPPPPAAAAAAAAAAAEQAPMSIATDDTVIDLVSA